VIVSARPASAGSIGSDKARAAALTADIQTLGSQISRLGQQYDLEQQKVAALHVKIADAKIQIARDKLAVAGDSTQLQRAAVNAYVNSGTVATTNPLFATNANELGATSVYNQIAEGNLAGSVANLTNAQANLASERHQLNESLFSNERLKSSLRGEEERATSLQATETNELNQANAVVKNQILLDEQSLSTDAISAYNRTPQLNFPDPPPDSRGAIAVDFALSMLGVPYVWGGASRSGVDCSGLTMLSWAAAGVDLPHYSGAQMADSTPVPVSDLEPGDLLFYGPGGDEHVAMFYKTGLMIEAPYTGSYVHVTPIRLYGGFVGAGRP
jgi:cell wall-associated NlpC family hydrolase